MFLLGGHLGEGDGHSQRAERGGGLPQRGLEVRRDEGDNEVPNLPQNFPRFLAAKQLFTKSATEFKKLLKEFWFTLYSRGNRILGSRLEQDKFCDF